MLRRWVRFASVIVVVPPLHQGRDQELDHAKRGEHKTSKHYGPFVAKLPSVLFNLSYCNVLYYVSLYG